MSTGSDFGEKVVLRVARGVRVRTLASETDAGGESGTGGKSNVSRIGVCAVIEWLLCRGVGGGISLRSDSGGGGGAGGVWTFRMR